MKEQKTSTTEENSDKEEDKAANNKQNTKNTNQSRKTNQQANANESTNANSPDWLMHLLTGAGALGSNYILFIKPLQEKFDSMTKAILMLEKKMEDQEEQIELLSRKIKKTAQNEEDLGEQNSDDLFTTKRKDKTNVSSMNGTRRTVRF